ncbi:MAG: hypothetical protein E7319_10895 [Clostridiales bacterium]|nr:hypothetical protein [Clostridiales bacterium]
MMDEKPIQIIPYLSFNGKCEEALQTYIEAFGGEILYLSRWSENTFTQSPEQIGKVMHAEFQLGSTRMSAGDSYQAGDGNTDIRLMVHMDTMEEAARTISLLANGGRILSPLKPHPAPDDTGCGSVTQDRFGYTWIITCPNQAKV